eukprot:CAMPEP_0198295006 /NCGR_PEP_ID=MMETSP1449-20131203/25338_1 /TAXON_ID=420275 /ORGANISM="Attheya septentrionalis, Strain CCMP2084" /LENGTH=353 /DNA_ID=CAMNT_0043995153 /DNA_START=58 /DNA_END=1119 /DNA_ORIENTATION=+
MFRKPKKLAGKAAFRSKQNRDMNQTKDDDDDDHGGKRVKAFRQRSSGDDESDEGGDDQGGSTSDILEQLRREKEPNKKRRVDGPTTSSSGNDSIMHRFEATGEKMTDIEMATRGSEHHPKEITRGAEESSKDVNNANNGGASSSADEPPAGGDGIYRGTKTTRNKFLAGPLKAPTFVRTTCRFDYQPDICKDYKDTGFCGYGDTCIYLHDRGDTLSGWQLEKEWEDRKQKEREKKEKEMDRFVSGNGNDSDENNSATLDDGLPFGCHLCRSPFTDPVVTTCGHYFCEKCIMDRVRSTGPSNDDGINSSLCPICNKDTHGVFNHPMKLVSKKRRMVGSKGTWQEFADAKRTGKS